VFYDYVCIEIYTHYNLILSKRMFGFNVIRLDVALDNKYYSVVFDCNTWFVFHITKWAKLE